MVELRLMVNDPKTGKSYKKVLPDCNELVGRKINDVFSGDIVGLRGFELQITGGSDSSGFPMRLDLSGTAKRRLLLTRGMGLHKVKRRGNKKGDAKRKGVKKRRSIRGNTVSLDIAQINAKIVKGEGIDKILAIVKEEKKEE